jgi:cellulose synthase/poly-beta-1,6-N-acetylglucosamine synthase-like glycosyltransferase
LHQSPFELAASVTSIELSDDREIAQGAINLYANPADLKSPSDISVVIPAFSMDRWDDLCAAVTSVRRQTIPTLETILVIDHNFELTARAIKEFPDLTVMANSGSRGASGARNTGAAVSAGKLLAFLDDDAVARPNWLERLLKHFDDPTVVGVGGHIEPLWKTYEPKWLPAEFYWAVGCSYRGMPETATRIRNVWSNNMAIRRSAFDAIGGFREGFGKLGERSRPEDTDLCIRAAKFSGGSWVYEPEAIAGHQVPADRVTVSYFLKRCFSEGQGKAELASMNGPSESTSTEREYTRNVLPTGVARGFRDLMRGELSGIARSSAIIAGLSSATTGFITDRIINRTTDRGDEYKRVAVRQ